MTILTETCRQSITISFRKMLVFSCFMHISIGTIRINLYCQSNMRGLIDFLMKKVQSENIDEYKVCKNSIALNLHKNTIPMYQEGQKFQKEDYTTHFLEE